MTTGGVADSFSSWFSGWLRWDSAHYIRIWAEGYPKGDPRFLVFPPGYPFLIGSLSWLSHLPIHVVAVLVNLASLLGAGLFAARLFETRLNVPPVLVFLFFVSSPVAYFAFSIYSDSVFCLLLWLLISLEVKEPPSERRQRMAWTHPVYVLIPWIRIPGYALLSWILLKNRRVLLLLVSLAGWLLTNYLIAGDPFYFLKAQELFSMPEGSFYAGLLSCLRSLRDGLLHPSQIVLPGFLQMALLPMIYLLALLFIAWWLRKRGENLLALTIVAILAVSHMQAFWRSVVRYDWPLLVLLCLPLLTSNRRLARVAFGAVTVAQFGLQIYFARIFHQGGWGF